ncbi:hypothetical protein ES332_A01G158100v1 [Gossypium tomentosum]|uniref:TTF-type domain-containing protein n=1 Tax=Gossypium tomentosum TaxID=34277 RepID=A0A5D2RR66_GOSTO|nr:hypothetical protein ES332_A01G158100v1 [Gossypium tomentosum]
MKSKTINSFLKKKHTETTQSPLEASQIKVPPSSFVPLNSDARPSKIPRVKDEALDLSNLEREPGLRKQIYEYPVNMSDEIRRAYINVGPYQPILLEYPASNSKKHSRYFQPSWFKQFSWLEYSPSKDAVFCLPCFLFNSNSSSRFGSTAFTQNGFSNWKKIHDRCNSYVDLMNQAQHIEVSFDRQTTQQISANRLCLKTSLDVVRWLSFQGCAFGGHDESSGSKNRENFLELLSLLASYDEKVEDIQERFFDIVHVKDVASLTLNNVIFNVLLQHSFDIQNILGQGYDGASNMRGEFNGLQGLILNDCQYAYYVHCFVHRLQLTLIAAAREVVEVYQFFKDLSDIVNIASASSKRHDELQKSQTAETTRMNQIGTLQRPGETRWSSHLNSVTSLLKMYNATSTVLENLKNTEKERLPYELKHYELDVCKHPDLRKISTLSDLCKSLVECGKLVMYPLVDRLIRLILTLPVSKASSERAFSAMKIVKTGLCSKMKDDFLRSSLVVYIEKEIAEKFDINEIIDDFSEVKD